MFSKEGFQGFEPGQGRICRLVTSPDIIEDLELDTRISSLGVSDEMPCVHEIKPFIVCAVHDEYRCSFSVYIFHRGETADRLARETGIGTEELKFASMQACRVATHIVLDLTIPTLGIENGPEYRGAGDLIGMQDCSHHRCISTVPAANHAHLARFGDAGLDKRLRTVEKVGLPDAETPLTISGLQPFKTISRTTARVGLVDSVTKAGQKLRQRVEAAVENAISPGVGQDNGRVLVAK